MRGGREEDFDILLINKKNWRESEITGYQNIQTSKTQGFLALLEEERGRKGVSGLAAIGREIGEEDIMISQVIRILNISWYGVSYMHLKDS